MWNSFIDNGIVDPEHLDELNGKFKDTYGDLVEVIHDSVKQRWSTAFSAVKSNALGVDVSTAT